MAILIIEGPDLVGKTAAIEKITKHFKRGFLLKNLYKPVVKGDKTIWAQYWRMINMAYTTEGLFILDRFYQSQIVYSILRGSDDFLHPEAESIEKYLRLKKDVFYIYLTCNEEELEIRYMKIGDEHVNLEQIKQMQDRYDRYYDEDCKLPKIKIDTRDETWLKQIEDLTGLKKCSLC